MRIAERVSLDMDPQKSVLFSHLAEQSLTVSIAVWDGEKAYHKMRQLFVLFLESINSEILNHSLSAGIDNISP